MNDPDILEQYCSAYYDKHGSYNDGFPCPNDTYCCIKKDGLKDCCPLNIINKKQHHQQLSLVPTSSTILSKINNDHKPASKESSTLLFNSQSASSLPLLLTK
jgi:hypothetical protein